jgi:DNA primase
MPTWIDFKELRSKLKFEDVLVHYGVDVKRRGEQHLGSCPLPGHTGSRKAPSFSANLDRGIFHCFGCQAKGNVLDFAVLMSGESIEDGRALKKVAADLRAKFFPDDVGRPTVKKKESKQSESPAAQMELAPVVNPALDFELQGLDPLHPYLADSGLTKETIAHFGLGHCSRGFLAGRIAIPLHDAAGKLVGYAGRIVDDAAVSDDTPLYRFPTKRERDGATIEFRKTLFLYNGFRFKERDEDLFVVEGFPSVWWLTQNGFGRTVATMGADCSDEQAELIVSLVKPGGHVWMVPDGDTAGEKFAHSLLAKLSPHRFVRWVKLAAGRQPTDLSGDEQRTCFTQ